MNKSRYILSTIFLAAAFVVAECASAEALGGIGPYTLYKDNNTCSVVATFDNGKLHLTFGISENGNPMILVSNRSWKISSGKYGVIRFKVDSELGWENDVIVIDSSEDTIGVRASFGMFKQIAQGRSLTIEAGNWRHVFQLKGTFAALKGLAKCAANTQRREASNPFVEEAVIESSNPFVDL